MQIHGRAKLGPAGRLALCEAIDSGMTFSRGGVERLAGDRAPVVASVCRRFAGRATLIALGG
jgi:hypothetical protein